MYHEMHSMFLYEETMLRTWRESKQEPKPPSPKHWNELTPGEQKPWRDFCRKLARFDVSHPKKLNKGEICMELAKSVKGTPLEGVSTALAYTIWEQVYYLRKSDQQ